MGFRIAILAAAAAAVAAPAAAQDTVDWTGFYVGGSAGVSWGDSSIGTRIGQGTGTVVIPPADLNRLNQVQDEKDNRSGFQGGLQGGYNQQMGNWVLGIETDIGFFDTGRKDTNSFTSTVFTPPAVTGPTYTLDQEIDTGWLWTVRPRIGYASGAWMVYGTAGLAMSDVKLTTRLSDNRTPANRVEVHDSTTKTGWIAGLGGAYMFSPNWSVRGEWLYTDLGHVSDTATTPNGFAILTSKGDVNANIVRVGVDYKF